MFSASSNLVPLLQQSKIHVQALSVCKKCFFRLSHTAYIQRTVPLFQKETERWAFEPCQYQVKHCFQQYRYFHASFCFHEKQRQTQYENPVMKLQSYLEIPILPNNEHVFCPSTTEMESAKDLFIDRPNHNIKFLKSAVDTEKLPDHSMPEVAFLGRSNVGKSSLIQAMFQGAPDVEVRVSKRPGHTRALNMYQVGDVFTLVDMPGYGYNMPDHFQQSVEQYLQKRRKLCRSFVLIDGEIGITATDKIGLKMMEDFKIPYVIVFTKIDKAKRHVLLKNLLGALKVRDETEDLCCFPQPFLVSSVTGEGLLLLQTFIAYITGNLHVESL